MGYVQSLGLAEYGSGWEVMTKAALKNMGYATQVNNSWDDPLAALPANRPWVQATAGAAGYWLAQPVQPPCCQVAAGGYKGNM